MRRRMAFACAVLAMVTAISGTTALAGGKGGFKTSRPSMLTKVMDGVTITPLLTVGDVFGDSGFRFESIPDGMSLRTRGNGRVDLYVNHETSKVPFPYGNGLIPPQVPSAINGQSDFDNSQVSHLILNQNSAGVLDGSFAISSSGGFQRFCSNFMATAKEGFSRDILFTNEESPDYAMRQENSWPPPLSNAGAEENGVTIAYDVKSGQYHTVYGMGRFNHENNVAIPGYDDLVVLSGDDTFTSGTLTIPPGGPNTNTTAPAQSQLYSYIASDTDALLNDDGNLWAFVSDNSSFTNYYSFAPGSTQSITGHFIQVPKNIATGKNPDGSELKAADVGYPAPDGGWQGDLRTVNPVVPIDGPQWVLEYWSHLNHVFQFVRVEDLAYDKRPGMGNVVYFADTGRATLGAPAQGRSTNGRIWRMVLDPDDPTQVDSLSILLDGDDSAVQTPGEIHQPDNVETTSTGLLVTEDPGGNNQFPANSPDLNATTARLWYVPFSSPSSAQVVAKIDQSADQGPTDVGPSPTTELPFGNLGSWETTGIVDASAAFGAGAYLINIQAHTLWIEKAPGPDTYIDANTDPDFTYKREGGQLLLIRIPGI
jgi:hypothetical protein